MNRSNSVQRSNSIQRSISRKRGGIEREILRENNVNNYLSPAIKDFIAGTVSGFAGKIVEHPFDTVKVLLQTQENPATSAIINNTTTTTHNALKSVSSATTIINPSSRYTSSWHCLQHTYQTKGFFGLYKGLSSPLFGSMFELAVLFATVGQFRQLLGETENGPPIPVYKHALAGFGAGFIVPLILTPVELIKCRLQVQQSIRNDFNNYKGPLDCIKQIVKSEGVQGLWRGNFGTTMRELPGNAFWFGTYEAACCFSTPQNGTKDDLTPLHHMACGASAGVAYWTSNYWADTVKSKIQTDPKCQGANFFNVLNNIIKTEGIRGLYRGWFVTVLRAAPTHAVIFAAYEQTMKFLK
eukprot:g3782.t1